jgi:FAD/FMN-containing dehydrogenase
MSEFSIKHPSAFIAREIENIVIIGKNSHNFALKAGADILARSISVTIFPIFLIIELNLKHIPQLLTSIPIFKLNDQEAIGKFNKKVDKVNKFCLGILLSPMGIRSPDIVSGLFLRTQATDKMIRPFGVEEQYGKIVEKIHYPTSIEELQMLVKKASQEGKQISIIGAGMSQGPQTVPADDKSIVINMRKINQLQFSEDHTTITVGAGATWEQIQMAANQIGKSVIVKQASDIFTVGGSIGINCHGWAHEYGPIASTVESLDIIDANGELKTITPKDELFGCMFGTLGYFGIIVSAKLKLTDNEYLVEKTVEVDLDEFIDHYKNKIKGHHIPLFGGRLVLDNLDGNPLRQVCMVRYEKEASLSPKDAPPPFVEEPKWGMRIERIALQVFSHWSFFTTRRIISKLWSKERQLMLSERRMTRNEALHPPINAFKVLHHSNLHAQWLQEYFITEKNLPNFLRFLGAELKANEVRLINATIRPTPKDEISILPYAEQDRYAVVICFSQMKTEKEIERTKKWMKSVNDYVISQGDVYYQAYMPFTTQEEFEKCYGQERVKKLREMKQKYDPKNIFGNGHTRKYFDVVPPMEAQ